MQHARRGFLAAAFPARAGLNVGGDIAVAFAVEQVRLADEAVRFDAAAIDNGAPARMASSVFAALFALVVCRST